MTGGIAEESIIRTAGIMRHIATTRAGRSKLRPIIALIGLIIVWDLSMPVIKLGLCDFPPPILVALCYLAAASCFLPVLIRRALPARRDLIAVAVVAARRHCRVIRLFATRGRLA
jgi:hypothetical protein